MPNKPDDRSLAASVLLSEDSAETGEKREAMRQKYRRYMDNENPQYRLYIIEDFVNQDRTNDPLGEAIAEMLRPILDIDFKDHVGTDHRGGAIARKMGLSRGWAGKKEATIDSISWFVEYLQEREGLSQTKAMEHAANVYDVKTETVKNAIRKKKK